MRRTVGARRKLSGSAALATAGAGWTRLLNGQPAGEAHPYLEVSVPCDLHHHERCIEDASTCACPCHR